MKSLKEKVYDWKDRLKDRHMLSLIVTLFVIIAILGLYIYKRETIYRQQAENEYNMAFFELVDYVQNVETYLAKSLISNSSTHGAEVLTHVWREANLAQAYLARLPIGSEELANTSKFLNQVSEYSFSLSRKNINNENLSQDDLDNLNKLHQFSVDLENTLNQLSQDMYDGRIKWGELTKKGSTAFATEVSNISKDSFSNLEENFHEYAGLIYDGAFSEHIVSAEKKGLIGENIDENTARDIVNNFLNSENVKNIEYIGDTQNTDVESYDYEVSFNDEKLKDNTARISISKKGGHVIFFSYNRNVEAEIISEEKANEIGKEFLNNHGYTNMVETYYLKQEGILTINYAYEQTANDMKITVYPDLIKVKIALDNGQVIGIESTGYLNSHYEREIGNIKIDKETAKLTLNKDINIMSEKLAIIPTEFKTEILCWEFKGKVEDNEFLVYINIETGKEEDILVVRNTPNGTLTM